jgi:hypothetical protein
MSGLRAEDPSPGMGLEYGNDGQGILLQQSPYTSVCQARFLNKEFQD